MSETLPHSAWHLIYNEDGTFRGYEWALDENGNPRPSQVYKQEGREPDGSRIPRSNERDLSPLVIKAQTIC